MAIGSSKGLFENCNFISSHSISQREKRPTPFSIDDILSKSKRHKYDSYFSDPYSSKCYPCVPLYPATIHHLSSKLLESGQETYVKWIEDVQRAWLTNSFRPFWFSRPSEAYQNDPYQQLVNNCSQNLIYKRMTPASNNFVHQLSTNQNQEQHKCCQIKKRSHSISFSDSSDKFSVPGRKLEQECSNIEEQRPKTTPQIKSERMKDTIDKERNLVSPISALEQLTCSTFKNMEEKQNILQAVARGCETKTKRRKCRTAFTALQLSVLEQRFSCQKYLTPSDRDQIAHVLGLSAPQVITWFQNRRAKQKRDLEELKNDIKTVEKWNQQPECRSSSPSTRDDETVEIDVEK